MGYKNQRFIQSVAIFQSYQFQVLPKFGINNNWITMNLIGNETDSVEYEQIHQNVIDGSVYNILLVI